VSVCLRVCVSVCAGWCLQVELPTVLELESSALGVADLAQTVSLPVAPGAARRPPAGSLGMGADDLPTTNWRRTQHRLDITLLALCGATYILSYYIQ
jgi:hypothetical protein